MKLRHAPASPFVRKVQIAAALAGLTDRIEIVPAQTRDPEDSLRQQNPLGKIPILLLDDGTRLYDSRVIVEYLASLAPESSLYPAGAARWKALRLQAIADGILDAVILQIYEERFRPEDRRSAEWVAYQAEKVTRALDELEAAPPASDGPIDIGHVALASALGYIDFRQGVAWRAGHPGLVAWLDRFAARVPSFAETAPHT